MWPAACGPARSSSSCAGDARKTELSPNGAVLACIDGETSMSLIDVDTGAPVFKKTQAFWLGHGYVLPWRDSGQSIPRELVSDGVLARRPLFRGR